MERRRPRNKQQAQCGVDRSRRARRVRAAAAPRPRLPIHKPGAGTSAVRAPVRAAARLRRVKWRRGGEPSGDRGGGPGSREAADALRLWRHARRRIAGALAIALADGTLSRRAPGRRHVGSGLPRRERRARGYGRRASLKTRCRRRCRGQRNRRFLLARLPAIGSTARLMALRQAARLAQRCQAPPLAARALDEGARRLQRRLPHLSRNLSGRAGTGGLARGHHAAAISLEVFVAAGPASAPRGVRCGLRPRRRTRTRC